MRNDKILCTKANWCQVECSTTPAKCKQRRKAATSLCAREMNKSFAFVPFSSTRIAHNGQWQTNGMRNEKSGIGECCERSTLPLPLFRPSDARYLSGRRSFHLFTECSLARWLHALLARRSNSSHVIDDVCTRKKAPLEHNAQRGNAINRNKWRIAFKEQSSVA